MNKTETDVSNSDNGVDTDRELEQKLDNNKQTVMNVSVSAPFHKTCVSFLTSDVIDLMKIGWNPQGSLRVEPNGFHYKCAQTMTKDC